MNMFGDTMPLSVSILKRASFLRSGHERSRALAECSGTHIIFRISAKEFAAMQCCPKEQSLIISMLDLAWILHLW
jgi:hypothetical protein